VAIQNTRPRHGNRARAEARPHPAHEHAAQEHDRSADIYEQHAALLDRFGAYRSARTERRHVKDERDAAETARQGLTADPRVDAQRWVVAGDAVPWLDDTDVSAARRFARALVDARTQTELRRRMLDGVGELVPAELLTWDRVELATGAVRHEAVPAEAEPPGAFAAVVGDAAGHPLLSAHAGRRREALRLSEAVEPRHLSHSELYVDLLHRSGVEYAIAIGLRPQRHEAVIARALREST
jgi:hypothetical protein